MHWMDTHKQPVIFGHRGASKYAPENTIAAFDLALQHGADAFELDTMLSADGVPVVIHDRTVDRTTDGSGKVDKLTIENLRTLDAGIKFSSEYAGEKIPTLEEVFNRYKNKAVINVELKNYHNPTDNLSKIVSELANKEKITDQIIFSSFLSSNLRWINRHFPDARVALLCYPGWMGTIQRTNLYLTTSPNYIHPYYKDVNKFFMEKQKRIERKVNTWTVNDKNEIISLIGMGVAGIITDDTITAVDVKTNIN